MKYKCVKAECPLCKVTGSIQLFLNRNGEVRCARTRHFSHTERFQAPSVYLLQNRKLKGFRCTIKE